jgi:hypothetical protein
MIYPLKMIKQIIRDHTNLILSCPKLHGSWDVRSNPITFKNIYVGLNIHLRFIKFKQSFIYIDCFVEWVS